MEKEKILKEIQSNITIGNFRLASEQIAEMAKNFSVDPFTLLTCASLLKTIDDEEGAGKIAERIPDSISASALQGIEVAKGLRGIGFHTEAEKMLSVMDETEDVLKERMRALFSMRCYSEALMLYDRIESPTVDDSILMIDALSAKGEHDSAVGLAKDLLSETNERLEVQRCYCSALFAGGRSKEAERYVKDNLKKNKSSSDANALVSYYLWIEGRSTSAGAYAAKAVKNDQDNIMAMEILAYCLIEKRKIKEAKTVAGAINEKDQGNSAVMRILDMCRLQK